MLLRLAVLSAALTLTGCDDIGVSIKSEAESECFSAMPANDKRPYMPVMFNKCTGESWLMVEVILGKEPADGFTYRWYKLDKIDAFPPTLVRN